ncbi:hypothetical protein F5B22DRAFT_612373 [Xylaria bambusicola]|uniref:uncharacterized protein n=1 Tax=Xylaria bambusicola TaxID=326684 RepID=UPI002008502C|nr:uncharacterized protein F5B22DRAFT_612373 [Xylaria bambusicola]KAI0513130.1 hypothetical protein F5B22DRAFT_612373 [Xylaria bambusicola]
MKGKNMMWLGATLVFSVSVIAASDSTYITTEPSLPEPSANGIIAAITPTSAGQIGINPVAAELGNPSDYVLTDFGPNNHVVTWDGQVYHYIEGHTGYLSLETITTTVGSKTSTMTSSVKVAVQTLPAGGSGLTFSEDIGDALRKSADAANAVCGAKKRSLRRSFDSTSCLIDAAVEASDVEGPLKGAATDSWWELLEIDIAQHAPEYLASAVAVLKSQARKKKTLAIVSLFLTGWVAKHGPLAGVRVPPGGVGKPDEDKTKCDSSLPAGQDSPLCQDKDCQGKEDTQKCTTGQGKGCACLLLGVDEPLQFYERTWWDQQEAIISSVAANPNLLGKPTPSCSLNSAGTAFDGKPAKTPAAWCVCRDSNTERLYATVDNPSSPCAYTSLPTNTISPTLTAVTGVSVTSCRMETNTPSASVKESVWCTCNDNVRYGVTTRTTSGSTTVDCLTPTPTRTSTTPTTPSATPTPTCDYPKPKKQKKKFTIEQEAFIPAAERFCSDNNKGYLRDLSGGSYGNVLSEYFSTGASKGGQLYLYAFLDKGCKGPTFINQDDCMAAYHSIFDHCDVGAAMRLGGAASINCQWFNITAEDKCVGTDESILHPKKCPIGYPLGYEDWPMGFIPS